MGVIHARKTPDPESGYVARRIRRVRAPQGGARGEVAFDRRTRVAGRLLKARQVLVLGLGTSSYLAGYAVHVLTPYLPHVWSVRRRWNPGGGPPAGTLCPRRCAGRDLAPSVLQGYRSFSRLHAHAS